MSRNTVGLTATLAAVEHLRHTPAGLPVVEFILRHASGQTEAGHQRTVEFEIAAKAAGDLATLIAELQPGRQVAVQGFLNRKHRLSRQMVLHVTNIEVI